MKKRLLLIVVAVLMVLTVFAGCSQQQSPAQSSAPASASQEASAAATSAAPASESASASEAATTSPAASGSNIVAGVDLSQSKDTSGNPLFIDTVTPTVGTRPANPDSLAETDPGHWFDYEFPYAKIQKQNLPAQPASGSDIKGKKVIVLLDGDHPYFTAYQNGAKEAATAFGLNIEFMSPNWDVNVQTQQVDQAINEKPDLIIYLPVDQKTSVQHLRKMLQAGIPVIGSNVMPSTDGFNYEEAFVGPDDWGQSRALADALAKAANDQGGYCVLTHNAGTSAYYARLYGVETEMAKVAPNMKLLDVQTIAGFDADKTKSTVSSWITKFGSQLNVIAMGDTTGSAIGSIEACQAANRTDIILGGIDCSKTALDYVQGGQLLACTNQPPMQDGALAVEIAAKWLSGEQVAPVTFMAPHVITKDNVSQYMPAQY